MDKMVSKWFNRQDNLVSESMAFFNASMPPQVTVMDTSDMLWFSHISSTISTI